jgi:hypothetical protein
MTPLAYLRLGAYAAIAIVIGLCLWRVHAWREGYLEVGQVRQEMEALKASQAASQAASKGLQDELQTLRDTRKSAPSVRVCKPAKPVPEAGAGRDGAAPGAGELPQTPGPDIGSDLYGLADEADELAARLRACQALLK